MKFLFVVANLFLTLFIIPSHAASCTPGTLTNQAMVDAFPPDCDTVDGDLRIRGNGIVNLTALAPLKQVNGNVYLDRNANLSDISGLANLESISGYLRLRRNNQLANLDALAQLTSVGNYLRLDANANLDSISGLSSLSSLGGYIRINNNDKLTSLAGLTALTSTNNYINIAGNDMLASLDGLSSLGSIGGYLTINNNDKLTSLNGLSSLSSLGGRLRITNNDELASLDGLSSLATVGGYVFISNNTALTTIAALSKLTSINGYLRINNNDQLGDLSGLESLSTLGSSLYIQGHAQLANLDALAGLTAITGFLRLDGNAGLTSIEGLAGISSVGNYLRIRNNDALVSLDGLHNLYAVNNNVTIDRNDSLSACSALIPLVDSYDDASPGPGPAGSPPANAEVAVDVGGFIRLATNAANCNQVSEITDSALAPIVTQAFSPPTIGEGKISTLTYTVDYSASLVRATELEFTNLLPVELTVASPSNATHDCTAGTLTASGDKISATGGIVSGGMICTISVDVQASDPGTFVNQTGVKRFTLGESIPSSATLNVVTLARSYSGALPGGTSGSLSFTSDDPACSFESDPQFLSADTVTPAPPETLEFADGVVSFVIAGCQPGAAVEVTVDYGASLPSGSQYWKAGQPWKTLPASINGSSVTFTLVDGGAFDDDGLANGRIVDPSGAATTVALPVQPVPVNQPLPLALVTLLLALLGGISARKALASH
jgi:hypothetical protein